MSSNKIIDDADLKSRLAHYGIVSPITNTTRAVLFKKLQKLEMDSSIKQTNQSSGYTAKGHELMDTTTNDLNEYEIRDGVSKLGYNHVPLTDATRPVLSKVIREKK